MNWVSEALDKLRTYEARKTALESIPAEIQRLELDYANIRSAASNSVPVQGGGSRMDDMLLANIIRREELARQLASAKAWVVMVDKALACLDDEDRIVLDRFYIHRQKGACERLCEELDREKSQVYRRRDRALRRFTLALYGGVES